MQTRVKSSGQIDAMREAGSILAQVLAYLRPLVVPGVSTYDLAQAARKQLALLGGEPVFLGYHGFPDVICISVNDEVVHGIPKAGTLIKDGDIVGLDFGVKIRGMITDGAISVIAGQASPQDEKLLRGTLEALEAGVGAVHGGVRTGDIGAAIEAVLKRYGFGIVRDLVGHGVGHELHEDPNIPNYGRANTGPWLQPGMTIAIEPMATLGGDDVYMANDGWTILTRDGSRSAHFEKTVLITEDGVEEITPLL